MIEDGSGVFAICDVCFIGRELAEESGIKNWQRASALNTYDK